ncbi:MAG: hypothetical protein NVV72_11360 [Asticcacaulis sp.]|nr:hypothetical protein [Asticcacaulis sp.]
MRLHRGGDETAHVLHRDLVHRPVHGLVVVEVEPHHQRLAERRPALAVEIGDQPAAGERRQAEGERPAIGVEAPAGPHDALGAGSARRADRAD